MTLLRAALWTEALKARRSKVPWLTALGFSLAPVVGGLVAATGWGAWFPWSVPALFSGLAGPRSTQVGLQSYIVVAVTFAAGLAGTFAWWHSADQTR